MESKQYNYYLRLYGFMPTKPIICSLYLVGFLVSHYFMLKKKVW